MKNNNLRGELTIMDTLVSLKQEINLVGLMLIKVKPKKVIEVMTRFAKDYGFRVRLCATRMLIYHQMISILF